MAAASEPAKLLPFGDRPPPQSLEAERAVISCLLQDAAGVMDSVLSKLRSDECFFDARHRLIFQTIKEMREDTLASLVDAITVLDRLTRLGQLDELGGEAYIYQLLNAVPTTANVEHYLSEVLDAHVLRNMIRTCQDVIQRCYETGDDVSELIDAIEQQILEVSELRTETNTVSVRELIREAVDFLDALSKRKPETMGLPTGFKDLDNLLTGLRPGDLIVVAARPSIGKTTLAMNIARNVAMGGRAVGVFSLEMGSPQLVIRLICSEAKINLKDVRDGRLTQSQWTVDIMRACDALRKAPIYIDDQPQLSAVEMRQKARRMKQNHDVQLIIIDYLQLMRPTGGNANTSREQEVSKMSREIKALAKELGLPIMLLAQLNRQAEQTGSRPKLSHLRESGAIEQDADIVALLHREREVESTLTPEEMRQHGIESEVIIAKNRNGETGIRKLVFLPQFTRFENYTGIADEDVPI